MNQQLAEQRSGGPETAGVSVASALDRLREAGQRILADEIGLARLQTQEKVSRNLRLAIFIGAGVVFGLITWGAFMVALFIAVAHLVGWATSAAVVGGLNAIIAVGAVVAGLLQSSSRESRRYNDNLVTRTSGYAGERAGS